MIPPDPVLEPFFVIFLRLGMSIGAISEKIFGLRVETFSLRVSHTETHTERRATRCKVLQKQLYIAEDIYVHI